MEKDKLSRLAKGRSIRIQRSGNRVTPASSSCAPVTALLDQMSDAFVMFDREWRYTYVNRAAAKLLQRSPQELLGKQVWTEVFPEEVGGLAYCNLHRAMAEQTPVSWEEFGYPLQRWLEVHAHPGRDGIALYFRDVTQRKQAEIAVQQSHQLLEQRVADRTIELEQANLALRGEQEKLKAIFNSALNPILLVDDAGHFLDANPAACQLLGVSQVELLNACIFDFAPPEFDTEALWQDFQTKGCLTGEFPIHRPDGTVRETEFAAIANILPHVHLSILSDITQRKQTEAALFQSNHMLQSLVNNSPDLIYVKDLQGRYLMINPKAAEWLDLKPEEVLGKTDFELFPPEFAGQFWQNDLDLIHRNAVSIYEELCPRHGEMRLLQTAKYPWHDQQGQVLGAIGVSRDLTDLKRNQAQLQLQAQMLSQVGDAVIAIDNDQHITYCNAATATLYGILAPDIIGQPLSHIYTYQWLTPEAEQAAYQALAESGIWRGENIHIKRNGEAITVESTVSVLTDENGSQIGLLATIRDVSEAKRREAERQRIEADLQKSQTQLHQQIAELESIYRTAPVGLSILDTGLRFVRINQRLAEINGVSVQDHIGRTVREVLPKLADEAEKLLQPVLETGEPCLNIELTGETPAQPGIKRTWLEHFLPLKEGDRVIGISVVCEEITTRKQAELALQEALQRLNLHFDTTPLGVVEWDCDMRVVRWSAAAERIFGWSAEQVLGRQIFDLSLVYPDDVAVVQEVSQRLLSGQEAQVIHANRNCTKDGRVIYCEWYNSDLIDAQGNVTSVLSFVSDVTERKQAEATIQQSKEQLQLLYDITRDLLVSTHPLDLIDTLFERLRSQLNVDVYLNYILDEQQQGLKLVASAGLSEPICEQLEWLNSGESVCETTAKQRQQLVCNNIQQQTTPLLNLPRSLGLTAYSCQPLIAQDKLYGTLSFGSYSRTCFTAEETGLMQALCDQIAIALNRVELITSLQQQTDHLREANRVKDEFLAILSHELRSPLNPILGWANLLQTRKFDPERTGQGLTAIANNAKLLTQLIDDLLDMARILRGKLTLQLAPVPLSSVIGAALETVRLTAEAKEIHLNLSIDATLPPLLGDATRLQQVMWNLLSNAIKFTSEGGRVEVKLESCESSVLSSQFSNLPTQNSNLPTQNSNLVTQPSNLPTQNSNLPTQNSNLVTQNSNLPTQNSNLPTQNSNLPTQTSQRCAKITVTDTGKGIPSDFLPYIFESFRQEDGSLTRKYGGLGLGLSISRQIVEMHGGTIWAESPGEGQGATFIVLLPLSAKKTPASISHSSLPDSSSDGPGPQGSWAEHALQGLSILFVDDDAATRDYVTAVLEKEQAVVTVVDSAKRALEVLQTSQPDLLLCDIAMPEMDGYSLIKAIRQLPAPAGHLPAIALTAYAGDQARQQALEAGFQRHLAKPIEPEQIVTTILQLRQTQLA